jgi:RNA-binding protein 25
MKPWVAKKIMEYLGEEEKTLIDFIMGKIAAHTPPAEILQQLTLVLDEEADIFVVKMWRMLVYEMYTASAK